MYGGLLISLLVHAGLIAWAVGSFDATGPLPEPAAPVIESELITLAEFTKLRQGDPNAKQTEARAADAPSPKLSEEEAPKPKPPTPTPPAAAAPPPEPPKAAETPPEPAKAEPPPADPIAEKIAALAPPVPTPDELAAKAEAEKKAKEEADKKAAEEQKKKEEAEKKRKEVEKKKKEEAEKKRLAELKRREEEKKKKFDADRIAALIDKTPEKRGSPQSGTSTETDYKGPTAGEREGTGDQLTAREADLLKGQLSGQLRNCWRLPGGGGGIEAAVVTIRWRLRPNGELDGLPEVVRPRNDPVYQAAARAAIAAVTECAPFRLPPDRYKFWRDITWDFDPRAML
ncbi:MAG: cell envelope integrity protein TolA [Hyphomicrobiaceae bacterium]|nr:cell envelope integrity protein TolA [Hyphomicrobiaceae bacterium]